MKAEVVAAVTAAGHEVLDLGTTGTAPVDYPDYARAIGEAFRGSTIEVPAGAGDVPGLAGKVAPKK